jgi:hypothetical protein
VRTHDKINAALGTTFADPDHVGETEYRMILDALSDQIDNAKTDGDDPRQSCLTLLTTIAETAIELYTGINDLVDAVPFPKPRAVVVTVQKTTIGELKIDVESATSFADASRQAMAVAGNLLYSEDSDEYEVVDVVYTK